MASRAFSITSISTVLVRTFLTMSIAVRRGTPLLKRVARVRAKRASESRRIMLPMIGAFRILRSQTGFPFGLRVHHTNEAIPPKTVGKIKNHQDCNELEVKISKRVVQGRVVRMV